MVAGALDEHRHLVGDQADVGVRISEDGEARAMSGRGDEQEPGGHLDNGLPYLAAAEVPSRAARQRLEPRGQRRQVFGIGPVQPA